MQLFSSVREHSIKFAKVRMIIQVQNNYPKKLNRVILEKRFGVNSEKLQEKFFFFFATIIIFNARAREKRFLLPRSPAQMMNYWLRGDKVHIYAG